MKFNFDPADSTALTQDVALVGGDGYLGMALKAYLKKKGYRVTVFDYFTDGIGVQDYEPTWRSYDVLIYVAGFRKGSTNDEAIVDMISAPIIAFEGAVHDSLRVVYVSSLDADYPSSSFFALSRHIVEVDAQRLNRDHRGDIRILRVGSVYGGKHYLRMKDSVIAKFAKKKLAKETINVYGDGSQVRDFIHINDFVRAVECAVAAETEHDWEDEEIHSPIDIGTGKGTSIISLARMFNSPVGFRIDEKHLKRMGVKSLIAKTEKAEKLFNFKAVRELKSYMKGV